MDQKRILITGASGTIGIQLVNILADSGEYYIDALTTCEERMKNAIEKAGITQIQNVNIITNERFFSDEFAPPNYEDVVHLAFARAGKGNDSIAQSLDYSIQLFERLKDNPIKRIIYVSSQGIYGTTSEIRKVGMKPAPASVYTMAKYAGEKLLDAYFLNERNIKSVILRLDNVIQSQNLVRALCTSALTTGELKLKGGKQCFSYIDVDDAANAIAFLLHTSEWTQRIYNVGPDRMRATLLEVAGAVKKIASLHGNSVNISLIEDDTELWAGMDTFNFINDTGWKPNYQLEDMIERIYHDVEGDLKRRS